MEGQEKCKGGHCLPPEFAGSALLIPRIWARTSMSTTVHGVLIQIHRSVRTFFFMAIVSEVG